MRLIPLASSSAGNCTAIVTGGSVVLVDAGIPRRDILRRLLAEGVLSPDSPEPGALFVTHEHGDHAAAVRSFLDRSPAPVVMTAGTAAALDLAGSVRVAVPGEPQEVAGLVVTCLEVPHDAAEPVAWRVAGPDGVAAVVTDLGYLPDSLDWFLEGVTHLLLEANYVPELMAVSPYPPGLRKRISGELGHLALPAACSFLQDRLPASVRHLWLGHLSAKTNHPAITSAAVADVLAGGVEWEVARRG